MLTHHGGQGTRRDAVTKKSRPHQLWRKKCRKKKQSQKRKCPRWVVVWSYMGHRAWQPRGCLALLAGLRPTQDFSPPFHDVHTHTVRNIHFLSKNSTLIFREKLSNTRENAAVLDFLAVDNFDFTRKIAKKILGWKTRENVVVLSKLNFSTFLT